MRFNPFRAGLLCLFPAALLCVSLPAQVIGTNEIATPLTRARIATLPREQQRAWLEYLQRSEQQKAADKQALHEEQQAHGVTDPQYAPMGRGAWALRTPHPADWYTSPDALRLAQNVVSYQMPNGGWSKNIDMTAGPRAPGNLYGANNLNRLSAPGDFDAPADPNWHYLATLDNDSTWMQIEFLARVITALLGEHRATEAAPFRGAVERGVEYLLRAQYPNGGWPQVWPLEGGYHDAITVNDNAMLHAIEVLQQVASGAPEFKFMPAKLARRAAPAARRGIECLLRLQVVEHGVKTGWAQQYDALTLQPTSARNYEMAALCSDETFPIVTFLMALPEPTPAEVSAVHAAAAWIKKVEIFGYRYGSGDFRADRNSAEGRRLVAAPGAGPIWARYYQMGSDRPIFGDRDKSIHGNVNEISRERRNGYAWFNSDGVAVLAQYGAWAAAHRE